MQIIKIALWAMAPITFLVACTSQPPAPGAGGAAPTKTLQEESSLCNPHCEQVAYSYKTDPNTSRPLQLRSSEAASLKAALSSTPASGNRDTLHLQDDVAAHDELLVGKRNLPPPEPTSRFFQCGEGRSNPGCIAVNTTEGNACQFSSLTVFEQILYVPARFRSKWASFNSLRYAYRASNIGRCVTSQQSSKMPHLSVKSVRRWLFQFRDRCIALAALIFNFDGFRLPQQSAARPDPAMPDIPIPNSSTPCKKRSSALPH